MINNSQSLLRVAEEFTLHGIGVIPTNDLKQPIIEKFVVRRGRVATHKELEDFFAPNGTKRAQYLAALLDSPKPLVALDLDGNGLAVFQKKVLSRCSEGLKIAINTTIRTKTPSKGLHIIFRIKSEDFPTGVRTREYWNELGNDKRHNQINLMGNGYYVVERGHGYSQINGPDLLVTLSKDNMQELLNVLEQFEEETNAIRKMATKLTRYYQPTNRDNLAFALSGYLHKNRVPKELCDNLV